MKDYLNKFKKYKRRDKILIILTLIIVLLTVTQIAMKNDKVKSQPVNLFLDTLYSEQMKEMKDVEIYEDRRMIEYSLNDQKYKVKYPLGNFLTANDNEILHELRKIPSDTNLEESANILGGFLRLIYYLILGSFVFILLKSMGFVDKVGLEKVENEETTFDDIAGYKGVKEEFEELLNYINNPSEYDKWTNKVSKNVLLEGPPGNGKTFFAKALAGTSKCIFFFISASDLEDKFIGSGARRIEKVFKEVRKYAKDNKKVILFIDELDAIGMNRESRTVVETNQTINKLLTEMDGFNKDTNVIIIAATNLAKVLDPALVRSGRFDKIITIPKPNLKDREAILELYINKKEKMMDPEVLEKDENGKSYAYILAQQTEGFCNADLDKLVNDASVIAKRKKRDNIDVESLREAFTKIVAGIKVERTISEEDRKIIAYHEAGHAVSQIMTNSNGLKSVAYITVTPYGQSLGHVSPISDNKVLLKKSEIINEIIVLLSGRAVEDKILNGDYTTGASSDLERANQLVLNYIYTYGMSEKYENISIQKLDVNSPMVQRELSKHLSKLYADTQQLIERHWDMVDKIGKHLLEFEAIDQHELRELLSETTYQQHKYL